MIRWLACAQPPVELLPPDPVTTPPAEEAPAQVDAVFVEPSDAPDLDPDPSVVRVELIAAPRTYAAGGRVVEGYAYNGQNPGPTLRARVGDTVIAELINELSTDTTLHWHGLSVPYAMDGVTWQTAPIGPGERFEYSFTVSQAGTFWYHPHFDSDAQVDLGLYGLIVVEDPADPPVDREVALVFDDFGEAPAEAGTFRHGLVVFPGTWAVNGVVRPRLMVGGGQVVRARLLNASNTRYLDLTGVTQIAADQGLLPAVLTPAHLVLAPGDRAELEWRVGDALPPLQTEPYSLNGGPAFGEVETLVTFGVEDPAPVPAEPLWPSDPTPPSPDPGTTDVLYVFSGGGDEWLINGEVYPDVTIASVALGQTAVVEVRNLSGTEHPFHLHGHTFEVLSVDGVPPPHRQVEDTVNVGIRQTVRILFIADNPGDWMAHCHILPHAHQGMMTVLRVGP